MGFVGMSTDQVWAHTERLRTAEKRLTSAYVQLDGAVQASRGFWRGPDAEAFQVSWADGAVRLLQQSADDLRARTSTLETEVAEQDVASQPDPGGRGADESARGEVPGSGGGPPGARYGGEGDGQVSDEVATAWAKMPPADKEKVLQEIVEQELARQGHPGVTVRFKDLDVGSGYWTEFDPFRPWRGEHIVIDSSHVEDPDALNTAAHEARHAAQDQWIEDTQGSPRWKFLGEDDSAAEFERIERDHGVTPEEIEAWRANDKDYKSAPGEQPDENAPQSERDAWNKEYEAYREQPLESDAFETGDEFEDEITLEELEQYQQDAGVPTSS